MHSAAMVKNGLRLGLIAFLAVGLVVLVHSLTSEQIEQAKLHSVHSQIIPSDQYDNDPGRDTVPIDEDFREFLGLTDATDIDKKIHIARQFGQATVAIIPTNSLEGYNSAIKMVIGINKDGTIAGVRVVEHNETPGLADYIDAGKSNWILSFNGKYLGSNFGERQIVVKNRQSGKYDHLTGATVTRKAIIRQVKKTLSYFQITNPLAVASIEGKEL